MPDAPNPNDPILGIIVDALQRAYTDELLSGNVIRPLDLKFEHNGQKFILQILEGTDLREFIREMMAP